jgi:pimeloyl-ACP methyl ester carboxylesterase
MIKTHKYKSVDGTPLEGILSLPSRARWFAMMLHGITVDKNEWNGFYEEMAGYLYQRGVGTFRFDFRGHGQSGGSSLDVSILGDVLDIIASTREISTLWQKPLSIVATSFGAGPAIFAAKQLESRVNRLVLIAPVLDYGMTFLKPVTPWAKNSFTRQALAKVSSNGYLLLDGHFKLSARLIEEFKWLQPWRALQSLSKPVLLIHGDRDSMVPFGASRKYFCRKDAWKFVRLAGADHGYATVGDESGNSKASVANKHRILEEIENFIVGGAK